MKIKVRISEQSAAEDRMDLVDENLDRVRRSICTTDLLMQLAEEASELSQACLKMARIVEGRNPVAEDYRAQAMDKLQEEYADVLLCARTLDLHYWDPTRVMVRKSLRWVNRLEEADQK